MADARLLSIQVGTPQYHGEGDETGGTEPSIHDARWLTSFWKLPVAGPIKVGRTDLEGNRQADLINHGGMDKAVLAYAATHYPTWRAELQRPEIPFGGFGENFTIEGWTEQEVCLGDVFTIGNACFAVSQPRQPCWKLGRRWDRADLPKRVVLTGRSGWYLRVVEEGVVDVGQTLVLQERPLPEWTVARVNHYFYHERNNAQANRFLADCSHLALAWREEFANR